MTTKKRCSEVKHREKEIVSKSRYIWFILVSTYFKKKTDQNYSPNMTFVHTIKEFKHNLADRFLSDAWLRAIDFSKLAIVGGCVLNALCRLPFSDTKQQDVNLVYYANDILDFKKSIDVTVNNLHKLVSQDLCNEIKVERIPGTPEYNVFLSCHVRLKFKWAAIGNSKNPLSHILHSFDMDICQIAFTGKSLSFNHYCIYVIFRR